MLKALYLDAKDIAAPTCWDNWAQMKQYFAADEASDGPAISTALTLWHDGYAGKRRIATGLLYASLYERDSVIAHIEYNQSTYLPVLGQEHFQALLDAVQKLPVERLGYVSYLIATPPYDDQEQPQGSTQTTTHAIAAKALIEHALQLWREVPLTIFEVDRGLERPYMNVKKRAWARCRLFNKNLRWVVGEDVGGGWLRFPYEYPKYEDSDAFHDKPNWLYGIGHYIPSTSDGFTPRIGGAVLRRLLDFVYLVIYGIDTQADNESLRWYFNYVRQGGGFLDRMQHRAEDGADIVSFMEPDLSKAQYAYANERPIA